MPEKITLDKSGANTAAIDDYNTNPETDIELRVAGLGPQAKYLNNIVEQDHRAIKRQTRPMLGFKSFWSAAITVAGIELMHMIRKGQLKGSGKSRPAHPFYSLATKKNSTLTIVLDRSETLRQNRNVTRQSGKINVNRQRMCGGVEDNYCGTGSSQTGRIHIVLVQDRGKGNRYCMGYGSTKNGKGEGNN